MNMRFMKRKAESDEQTQRRQSGGSSLPSSPSVKKTREASTPGAPENEMNKNDADRMDVDTPEKNDAFSTSSSQPYSVATSIDMYGMQ